MSQPPYPSPGGSDTGDQRPAGPPPQDTSARPYPEWQPAPDAAASPPPGGRPPYPGPPGYGPPSYGPPQYGQAPYGQPPYGQPPQGYGAPIPPWGQGASTARRTSKVAVVLAALAALVVTGLAVALLVWSGSDDDPEGGGSGDSSIPAATSEPEGLGDDAELDAYAEECYDGDMQACDDLYRESPRSSAYELYGGTCAGRQPNADASEVFCVDAFPPAS